MQDLVNFQCVCFDMNNFLPSCRQGGMVLPFKADPTQYEDQSEKYFG